MKIDIQFGRPFEANEITYHQQYVVPFTIAGGGLISTAELIKASQTPHGMRKIEQQILAELSALIQVELYGRIISNESETTSNKPKSNSKESKAIGGLNKPDNQTETGGSERPNIGRDNTTANSETETEIHEAEDKAD